MTGIVPFSDQWVLNNITEATAPLAMTDWESTQDIARIAFKYDDKRVLSIILGEFKKKAITSKTRAGAATLVSMSSLHNNAFMLKELLQLEGYSTHKDVEKLKVDMNFVQTKPEVFQVLMEFKCDCCSKYLTEDVLCEAYKGHSIPVGIMQHAPMEFLDSLFAHPEACDRLKLMLGEAIRCRGTGESLENACMAEVS